MTESIPSLASDFNKNFSQSTVVRNAAIHPSVRSHTVRSKPKWLPTDLFKIVKAKHHKQAKEAVKGLGYRAGIKKTLEALVNLSDVEGVSSASHQRLACDAECTTKTTERHTDRLHKDGVIQKIRNGKRTTNTYILLFIKNELPDRTDKMSAYLNPLKAAPKREPFKGVQEEDFKREGSPADALPSPKEKENDIWDDEIKLTDEEKMIASAKIKALKDLLRLNS